MPQSMPETPLVRSLIGYGFWRTLRRLMPPEEYEQYVKYWNSRYGTGSQDSRSSNENSND